jgi:hypothetical protein
MDEGTHQCLGWCSRGGAGADPRIQAQGRNGVADAGTRNEAQHRPGWQDLRGPCGFSHCLQIDGADQQLILGPFAVADDGWHWGDGVIHFLQDEERHLSDALTLGTNLLLDALQHQLCSNCFLGGDP